MAGIAGFRGGSAGDCSFPSHRQAIAAPGPFGHSLPLSSPQTAALLGETVLPGRAPPSHLLWNRHQRTFVSRTGALLGAR